MRTTILAAGLAGLVLAGCAGYGTSRTQTGTQETITSASATVQSVDQSTRAVTLRDNADGTVFTVTAGPEVRNFAQVEAGDQVQIDYYQATTVDMASPGDTGEAQTDVLAGRAPEGERPAGVAAATTSLVVTVVSYDRDSGLATFRTPDGLTRRAVVPPRLRSFASNQGPGSRVLVTMTDAVAVTITEGTEATVSPS